MYNDMKGKVEMWEDITSSLTWQTGKRITYSSDAYTISDATGSQSPIYERYAELSVSGNEWIRYSGWTSSAHAYTDYLVAALDSSNRVLDVAEAKAANASYFGEDSSNIHYNNKNRIYIATSTLKKATWTTVLFRAPKRARKLIIMNYALSVYEGNGDVNDIMIEKA